MSKRVPQVLRALHAQADAVENQLSPGRLSSTYPRGQAVYGTIRRFVGGAGATPFEIVK